MSFWDILINVATIVGLIFIILYAWASIEALTTMKERKEFRLAIKNSGGVLQHFISKINPNQEQDHISIIKSVDYQYDGVNPSKSLVITDSYGSLYFIQWILHEVLYEPYPLSYQMIHFSEIKGIELFVDNQRVFGNKIAAAVVGGLFLGIVGLVSGVLISQNKSKQKYTIYLSTNNLTYPSIEVECKDRNTALEILGTLEILENRQ